MNPGNFPNSVTKRLKLKPLTRYSERRCKNPPCDKRCVSFELDINFDIKRIRCLEPFFSDSEVLP